MKNVNKSKLINFFVVLAVILLLIFFDWRGLLSVPNNLTLWAMKPFLKLFQAADRVVFGSWNFLVEIKNLNKENIDLKNKNSMLLAEITRLREIGRENEILRKQLGLSQAADLKFILAEVIGYNPTMGQYFLIDKGRKDGLSDNLAVVAEGNFLVGRIVEVLDNFSKALLISDSNFAINAMTQDTRISGVVKGNHGLGVIMDMIPIDAQIKADEVVLTSGLNDDVPKGLIIGKIADLMKKASAIFQSASIVPAVEINNLEKVFVIIR